MSLFLGIEMVSLFWIFFMDPYSIQFESKKNQLLKTKCKQTHFSLRTGVTVIMCINLFWELELIYIWNVKPFCYQPANDVRIVFLI